jgi:2-isopropylmalate synthase
MHSRSGLTLYDTTLRDGTQGEGINFSLLDKLRIAEKLDAFGMHYIEAGWPGSNPKDAAFFEAAKKRSFRHARIAAFGSTRRAHLAVGKDPQIALLLEAQTPVVTIFGKSWGFHVSEILGVDTAENRAMIADSVRYLKAHGREVIYDAEHFFDGYKDDHDHALATIAAACDGGADLVVLCDTNGGTMPDEFETIFRAVAAQFPGVPLGIHTHNDCGLGVANALAAVRAGAVQVQGTVNGYGERTGNCNLTTLIPCLQAKMAIPVVADLSQLTELSFFVDEIANCARDPRAPFVGSTAFTHKGGVHAHAVQKYARSYEHMDPAAVGNRQSILISELSGQSNVIAKLEALGVKLEKGSPEVAAVLAEVKRLENEGYEFEAAEASFELLVRKQLGRYQPLFTLHEYHCDYRRTGNRQYENCEATVKLSVAGRLEYTVAEGAGPVNALDAALRKALRPFYPQIDSIALQDYKVRIIDSHHATAARTRVLIVSSDGRDVWSTVGASGNIIEASWLALIDGLEYKLANSSFALDAA